MSESETGDSVTTAEQTVPANARAPRSPTPTEALADIRLDGVPIAELFRRAPRGDYRAYVELIRAFHGLCRDRRTAATFAADVLYAAERIDVRSDPEKIRRRLAHKDTTQRFSTLQEERQIIAAQPSLLSGKDFEECLAQYKALIAHVESLWADACHLFVRDNHPLATFLSILVIEEIGKPTNLKNNLVYFDVERAPRTPRSADASHKRKQLIGVFSGALVNARLDRVLGFGTVRKLLNIAQSNAIEQLRQDCLYLDVDRRRTVTPRERIGTERARVFTVFAGEVMAEVLGHFPWDFERMLDSVITFEVSIGMPERKIERG